MLGPMNLPVPIDRASLPTEVAPLQDLVLAEADLETLREWFERLEFRNWLKQLDSGPAEAAPQLPQLVERPGFIAASGTQYPKGLQTRPAVQVPHDPTGQSSSAQVSRVGSVQLD